jgi:hypothetical protein
MSRLAEGESKPEVITSGTREDKLQSIRFLEKRGFEQVMRWPMSYLDVTTFEFAKFEATVKRVWQQGIEILSGAELAATDPDWQHNLILCQPFD